MLLRFAFSEFTGIGGCDQGSGSINHRLGQRFATQIALDLICNQCTDAGEVLRDAGGEIAALEDRIDSLRPLIAKVNEIRRANPALQSDRTLAFHATDNPMLICYSKMPVDPSAVRNWLARQPTSS